MMACDLKKDTVTNESEKMCFPNAAQMNSGEQRKCQVERAAKNEKKNDRTRSILLTNNWAMRESDDIAPV